MTRVSENSSTAAVHHSISRVKSRLEDLQMKGASLRRMTRPSDNPMANAEALSLGTKLDDTKQYLSNSNHALMQLDATEKSIEQITNILVKAKELAIAQSSGFYSDDVRRNVANEVDQLHKQTLAIANKRLGPKYIFGGHKTLTAPFDGQGHYRGDREKINLEVSKDFFVPINLHGAEVFYASDTKQDPVVNPLQDVNKEIQDKLGETPFLARQEVEDQTRQPASVGIPDQVGEPTQGEKRANIFSQLATLTSALENNDNKLIQDLLEEFDESISRLITLRTRIGSITNSVENAKMNLENDSLSFSTRKSFLMDADVAELFADLTKQQDILKTTYNSSSAIMNKKLLDFIR